jgi:hypothetical protein
METVTLGGANPRELEHAVRVGQVVWTEARPTGNIIEYELSST